MNFTQLYDDILGTKVDPLEQKVEVAPVTQNSTFRTTGYWEAWGAAINPGGGPNNTAANASYYVNDLKPIDNVLYSFLTLDEHPNSTYPRNVTWNGTCIIDSETSDCVANSLNFTGGWKNPDNWQAVKVEALYNATKTANKTFIFSLGGASDLKLTMDIHQVWNFSNDVSNILRTLGDGFDFDFEHLTDSGDRVK